MSDEQNEILDRVMVAKADAEVSLGHKTLNGQPLTEVEKATVLIAMVQAVNGNYEIKNQPEGNPDGATDAQLDDPSSDAPSDPNIPAESGEQA
jgi:hypothetical protein